MKYNHEAEKKNLTFRSKNIDREVFSPKDKPAPEGETEDKGAPGTVLSVNSDGAQSPTDGRANEQSRSLEQVQGARMQQPS